MDITKAGIGGVGGMAPGGLPGAEGAKGSPGAGSVERLNDLLNAAQQQQPQPPADPAQVAGAQPAETPGAESVTGRVLDNMNSINQRLDRTQADILAVFDKPDATQMDLIKANFALLESGTIVSAASKVAEKVTQGVKNLQQG